ncbi:metallophosphoesterase [Chitinophaga silvatica]|uniref:Metallophosphoesterase n=1 Tax=Chitinophaga silvatica TaxID=2282649 RepID=A0A3E1YBT8_9BACT|nr:metallophosphoesterase [Chitinophaga silvatica]RFS23543.1 metallophosphoesterase [Chitinophaga silvatica]
MRISRLVLAFVMLPCLGTAQKRLVDGPYVFYEGDSAVVKTIYQQEDLASAVTQKYPVKSRFSLNSEGSEIHLKPQITIPANITPAPEKLYVLSDIEGEFDAGYKLLLAGGVIDPSGNWTFGKGHLVIAGDLFDRGTQVLPWLWLLYTLEDKAVAAGGQVHVILGNHDIMQLAGDFRYTDARYFKYAWLMGRELKQLFGEDSELGRWLRSKNVVEKIGDLLVMHAGMSPALNSKQLSLTQINDITRPLLGVPRKQMPDSLQVFFNGNSPFWYRGYFYEPVASMATIDSTLKQYGCKHIIVGHTITDTVIVKRFDGKVIGVDVDQHEGQHKGLYVEAGKYYQVGLDGKKTLILEDI